MDLFIFVRFHSSEGHEDAVERALAEVVPPSREEAGCVGIHAFRSTRDRRLFYIHSHWKDEAAFELHAGLAHTVGFIKTVEALLDQPLEVTRAKVIA